MPDHAVESLQCLTGLIAEDDLVNHRLQASLGLDLIPRDERLARFDAGASLTSYGGISEVLEHWPGRAGRSALAAHDCAGRLAVVGFVVQHGRTRQRDIIVGTLDRLVDAATSARGVTADRAMSGGHSPAL